MQQLEKPTFIIIAILTWLFLFPSAQAATAVDHGLYAQLLSRHVHNGRVDYRGFKTDEAVLDRYLQQLADVDPAALVPREAMAFYINLYNAWTVKLILGKYPDLKSIKDLGSLFRSPWKKNLVRLNGQTVTLDHIEHEILRPRYKDPRIHFAVNCASRSCPALAPFAYAGDRLDQQLDTVTAAFLNDPDSNYFREGTLYVSQIFKWYGEDFNHDVVGFFRKYAREGLKEGLDNHKTDLRVTFLDYDWSLNSVEN